MACGPVSSGPWVTSAGAVGLSRRSRRLVMTQNTVPPAASATAIRLSAGDIMRAPGRRRRSPGAGIA
jgi:hypothetical protein